MFEKLWIKFTNLFHINCIFEAIEADLDSIKAVLENHVSHSLDLYQILDNYDDVYQKYLKTHNILSALEENTSDMQWVKDFHGRYLYANKSIKTQLLNCDKPLGLTDIEIAEGRRLHHGADNHTAGETCFGSDLEVIMAEEPMKFIEEFVINGKRIVLEVNKAPIFDDEGNVFGTVGTGRVITSSYDLFRELAMCAGCNTCNPELVDKVNKDLEIYNA